MHKVHIGQKIWIRLEILGKNDGLTIILKFWVFEY